MNHNLEKNLPFLSLPLTLLLCFALWFVIGDIRFTEVYSENGVWDLRGFDFENESARIVGPVEFIGDALLTPEEFEARREEIQLGRPQDVSRFSTSRVRILLPEGATYTIAGRSNDYSDRFFINGKQMGQIGTPGASKEESIPDTASYFFMDEPVDGEMVIVRQTSNFVHRASGWTDSFRIGYTTQVRPTYRNDSTAIVCGSFLALFLVHLSLYFILRSYRANLYFSLFCLTWFLRAGVTEAKLFSTLVPTLSWEVKFRMEYLALPVTGIFIILLLSELFPGVLPAWFRRWIYVLSAVFIGIFLFTDTLFMSWAMFGCYAYQGLAILLVAAYFLRRFRNPRPEQIISLFGAGLFLLTSLRDMFFYSGIVIPPSINTDMSQISMLVFVLLQMTAMFMGTVRAVEDARAVEQRLAAENAALDRLNFMKSDMIATISHETRTPLAVLSGYAELISLEMSRKGVDEQTASDLAQIADEAQRLADIMTKMQALSKGKDKTPVRLEEVVRSCARLYTSILQRQGTALTVDVQRDLPAVYGNADELTQVLFNLLSNAHNHTKYGDEIAVTAARDGDFIAVTVKDTGSGISPEFLPRIFIRGVHGRPEGSGLGLAICKEIVEGLDGEITIESEPGKGTAAAFKLPAYLEVKEDGHHERDHLTR